MELRIIELVHDVDHPEISNIDLWVKENKIMTTKKILAYKDDALSDFEDVDLILLHGGAQHLWRKEDNPWLYKEVDYVRKALEKGIPVVGFCLGAQIIADAMGAEVFEADEKEIGWYRIIPKPCSKESVLMEGFWEGMTTFLWHSDHYKLPTDFLSLAFTEAAEHQVIVGTKYPAVGFQFHPEYTLDTIRYFCNCCYEEEWTKLRSMPNKEQFLEQLSDMLPSYGLFKQLMGNTIKWFSSQFGLFEKIRME